MRDVLMPLAVLAVLACGGCSSGPPDDAYVKPGSGVALNPGGKPQTPEEAAYAAQMLKAGAAMNADRASIPAAMAAAQARTGGK